LEKSITKHINTLREIHLEEMQHKLVAEINRGVLEYSDYKEELQYINARLRYLKSVRAKQFKRPCRRIMAKFEKVTYRFWGNTTNLTEGEIGHGIG